MSKLKIAIQKKGRLYEESIQLLKESGLNFKEGNNQLKIVVENFALEILLLRNADIPQYVEDGIVDLGIVGENILIEQQVDYDVLRKLGFASCRLSLAIPKAENYNDISALTQKRIATSYPNTLRAYLTKNNIQAEIHTLSGSVEIAPNIGLADAVCDLVSSGTTLFNNGLREVETILNSEAVLIKSQKINSVKQKSIDKLVFRMDAVLRPKKSKYVLLNVPNDKINAVSQILPVLKSPTVLPLAQPGWSSLHSVIDENQFWSVIDQLKASGAEDILIIPINKMVL
ncbi:ATP phosphoribosyltransferase [uncultured Mesonia sp.]|uniref:ATP phosphoribosyltransferase n=1 Tax=uncultured Mesonia sp. TaxID=399731 RepID=UPI00374ED086